MAKRIIMIPPFEVLTGNLSGKQDLQYAENNNPAYEAPNGSQGARNYITRYVGARRSDGKSYFAVRRKNTVVLNGKTRRQMAVMGSLQDIIAKMKITNVVAGTNYTYHQAAFYNWSYDQKGGAPSIDDNYSITDQAFIKWEKDEVIKMLKYKHASITFRTPTGTAVMYNPYNVGEASRIVMKQAIWDKFAGLLAFGTGTVTSFSIDGKQFINPNVESSWDAIKSQEKCPNLETQWAPITIVSEKVKYNSLPVYDVSGVEQTELSIPGSGVYSTIDPTA